MKVTGCHSESNKLLVTNRLLVTVRGCYSDSNRLIVTVTDCYSDSNRLLVKVTGC